MIAMKDTFSRKMDEHVQVSIPDAKSLRNSVLTTVLLY